MAAQKWWQEEKLLTVMWLQLEAIEAKQTLQSLDTPSNKQPRQLVRLWQRQNGTRNTKQITKEVGKKKGKKRQAKNQPDNYINKWIKWR